MIQSNIANFNFRNDIGGLRGIAILFVILFHTFPEYFQGGFVGVDIFFVISGYLINSIIFNQLKTNTFSLINFYKKRIIRIFPSLVIVMSAFILIGYFLLTSDEYSQMAKHIVTSSFFVSNYVLFQEVKYFDSAALLKPMLHTWSLSIEEQFYVIWPALSILFWSKINSKVKYIWILPIVSFICFLYYVNTEYNYSFYNLLTRFWEIGFGCLLAYAISDEKEILQKKFLDIHYIISNSLVCISSLYLVYYFFRVDHINHLYGAHLVLIIIATSIILYFKNSLINEFILSNALLRYFGKISYPLYLWHWPILSFGFILNGAVDNQKNYFNFNLKVILLLISFLLSVITYHFVEIKLQKKLDKNKTTSVLLLIMLFVSIFSFMIYISNGLPGRYKNHTNDKEIRHNAFLTMPTITCGYENGDIFEQYCSKTVAGPQNIVLFGDSHAQLFYGAFVNNENNFYNKVILLAAGGCQPISSDIQSESCRLQYQVNLNFLNRDLDVKYIVLSNYPNYIFENSTDKIESYFQSYQEALKMYKKFGKKIVFMIDGPWLDFNIDSCMMPDLFWRRKLSSVASACAHPKANDFKNQEKYLNFVNRLKKSNLGILFFDVRSVICDEEICNVSDNDKLLFYDDNHLSQYATKKIVDKLIEFLEKNR